MQLSRVRCVRLPASDGLATQLSLKFVGLGSDSEATGRMQSVVQASFRPRAEIVRVGLQGLGLGNWVLFSAPGHLATCKDLQGQRGDSCCGSSVVNCRGGRPQLSKATPGAENRGP